MIQLQLGSEAVVPCPDGFLESIPQVNIHIPCQRAMPAGFSSDENAALIAMRLGDNRAYVIIEFKHRRAFHKYHRVDRSEIST